MVDEITLYAVAEVSRVGGVPVYSRTPTEVFAEVKSVTRSEWYAANQSGRRADIVFVINADEYDNQTEALYGSTTYNIIRSYRIGLDRVELTCEVKQ